MLSNEASAHAQRLVLIAVDKVEDRAGQDLWLSGVLEKWAVLVILLLVFSIDAGNEKWNDPEMNHPTGGFLYSEIPLRFIPTFPTYRTSKFSVTHELWLVCAKHIAGCLSVAPGPRHWKAVPFQPTVAMLSALLDLEGRLVNGLSVMVACARCIVSGDATAGRCFLLTLRWLRSCNVTPFTLVLPQSYGSLGGLRHGTYWAI